MTSENFSEIFSILGLQLRLADFDELTLRSYFEALKDLPVQAVQQAGRNFAIERGRRFFPTTAEWFTAATALVADTRRKELDVPRDGPWRFDCNRCEDIGWERFICPGDYTCGRKNPHAAHDYVEPCACRPTNRTYQRHHEARS